MKRVHTLDGKHALNHHSYTRGDALGLLQEVLSRIYDQWSKRLSSISWLSITLLYLCVCECVCVCVCVCQHSSP